MAHVQNSSNGDSNDDDDENEEEDPMEESLVNLVGNTIKELAPAAQVFCRKQIILEKLRRMGIFRVVDLRQIMDADIQMVVAALSPTPLLFAFKLKEAVTAVLAVGAERQSTSSQFSPAGAASPAGGASTAGATSPANATSPAGTTPGSGAFQTPPINAAPAATPSPNTSVIATVKIGPQTYIGAHQFTVTVTTSFAELLRLAISGKSEVDRAKLEGLPVKVETFTGPQHLSTHKADASLSALVTDSISLGYRHIVFTHALPAQKPASSPPRYHQYAVAKCESGEYLTKRHQGLSTALNAIGCSTLFLHTSDLLLTSSDWHSSLTSRSICYTELTTLSGGSL